MTMIDNNDKIFNIRYNHVAQKCVRLYHFPVHEVNMNSMMPTVSLLGSNPISKFYLNVSWL